MRTDKRGDPLDVRRGVPQGAEGRAAELYWEAFADKLGPALKPRARGVAFLAAHMNRDRAVCALRDGALVGLAGLQYEGRSLTRAGRREMIRAYGPLRGPYRYALLATFKEAPGRSELKLDGIAVDAAARGRGIGELLIEEVSELAAETGHSEITLDVVDSNPRARGLYERLGFTAVSTKRTPHLRRVMGFGAVTLMRRPAGG
ncbi:GNAT family N-acetyltransferase [Streptomyces iconiensis]|uniref:GNAT family N-acetyltransferase n=1 Tax=Streptomyces iconiensis TaxID=1384038 RepID=A0ABT6ZN27_9ACTN|nr:GNAT family N-acetyltransferase [Streptomyces iconiensis]MDJ1130448.1 GNAT family N-acetyltransferase [Streptomyces iconiensis]